MAFYDPMAAVYQGKHFLKFGNLMIDLETLGKTPDAQIILIAAVEFNKYTGEVGDRFQWWVDATDWGKNGRVIDGETVAWWLEQSDEARQSLKCPYSNCHGTLLEGIVELRRFYNSHTNPYAYGEVKGDRLVVWGNGSTFDISMLENAYRSSGLDVPWDFYSVNDVRTVVDFCPEVKKETAFEGVKHSPLSDCLHQIKYLSGTIQRLDIPARELTLKEGETNDKVLGI